MKKLVLALGLALSGWSSAWAALDVGDRAPNFAIPAAIGGKVFTFSLADSLANGSTPLGAGSFEPNLGQFDSSIQFASASPSWTFGWCQT